MHKKDKIAILLLSLSTMVIACVLLLMRAERNAQKKENLPTEVFMSRIRQKVAILRQKTIFMLESEGLSGQNLAVVSAMAFGEKRLLSKETRNAYSQSGVAHLLALSGTHLAILFFFLSMLFGGRWSGVVGKVLTLATIWLYALFAGLPASLIRAATMLTIMTIVTLDAEERYASMRTLVFTALIMFIFSPLIIFDRGFQLSFLAVAGIFILNPRLSTLVPLKWQLHYPPLRWLWSLISISVSAQLFTAPLVFYYFGTFSTWFLVSNLVAIPLVTLLLYSVCLCFVCWWITPINILLVKVIVTIVSLLNSFVFFISS